ncbi:MAG TPA: TrgA family protein [Roseovarius sp.]|nr:TrgA family protein [Roseovarius sp.]
MPLTDNMPTFARLVAGLLLGAVGWWVSDLIRPLMPEGTDFGIFNFVNAVLGILVGWRVTGKRLGHGLFNGLSAGLTGVAALVFWGLFVHSLNQMLGLALESRFGGLMQAINAMLRIMTEYALVLTDVQVIVALVGGGIATGLIGEWVARRWS